MEIADLKNLIDNLMARNVICDKGKDGRESFFIITDDMNEEFSQDALSEDNNTTNIESEAREIFAKY